MFFDELNQKELTKVENIGIVRKFAPNDAIICEGSHGSSFSIILSGSVQVRKSLRGGHFKALIDLGPLDLIGELGFFGAVCRTASVIATTETEIMEFERTSLNELIDKNPAIGAKIYRGMAEVLAARLATSDESLMDTIIWALGSSPNKSSPIQVNIAARPKLVLRTCGQPEQNQP